MSLRLSGGRRLQSPPGDTARPTPSRVRLAVMNILAAELPGCRWLDLCCGSGAMGCEALLRGAAEVMAIERHRQVSAVARANLESVAAGIRGSAGDDPGPLVRVHCGDVVKLLHQMGSEGGGRAARFDLIYADPPYAAGLYGPIAHGVETGGWLRQGGTMVWECASDAVPQLPERWQLRLQRHYGGTTVLLLNPPDSSVDPADAVDPG
ncbi:MAG: 16S rRNA (guanine(966)-N(2))-methyltransferase RsmD [Cyanobacteriota bacterium]